MPGGFCFSTNREEELLSESTFINISPGADYEARLEDAILNLGIDVAEDDVECCIETARISLSPIEYDEDLAEKMFHLSLRNIEREEKVLHETDKENNVRISFGIDSELYNFLIRTFQYINFHHPIIAIIDEDKTRLHNSINWMITYVSQGTISIVAFKDGKLHVANCSETMVTQNRVYQVLNTWTQLNFDVLKDTLYIIGKDNEVAKIKKELSIFIKQCE
ncbi:MAG: DUF3822 family protein [Bacteroidales bacterium]|nr:DUF3822 family protein [Bacteroidales bacterium]